MKFRILPFLPIPVFAVLGIVSAWLVESPPYSVSIAHGCLVFALGLFGWFYVAFGVLRQSCGGYVTGSAFLYLMLLSLLFPDMWLRWPDATLAGMAITFWLATGLWKLLYGRDMRREAAVLAAAVGLAPMALLPYWQWPASQARIIAGIAAVALLINAVYLWIKRQRFSIYGLFSWIFFVILTGIFLLVVMIPLAIPIHLRQMFEPALLFALLFLASLFVADLLRVEQQLRRGSHLNLDASLKDPLTGLANRRALELHGPQVIRQSHQAGRAVSLIIGDIDHFKQINDLHGHLTGDAVLRQIATELSSHVRKSDLVARYGGEEFVVILPGSPLAPALRLAERMRAAIENSVVEYEGRKLKQSISFGVVTAFPEEPTNLSEMIERADANLYRAKRAGRNRVMTDEIPGPGI